ncbi:hypothetical protein C0991_003282, partial [Blastosporella zonata]
MAHRRVKQIYPVIQKSSHTIGIARYEQRQRILRQIRIHAPVLPPSGNQKPKKTPKSWLEFQDEEHLPPGSPNDHHIMSHEVRHALYLPDWLSDNEDDPALK